MQCVSDCRERAAVRREVASGESSNARVDSPQACREDHRGRGHLVRLRSRARTAGIAWGDRLITVTWGHFALLIQALQGITESLRTDVLDFLRAALRVVPVVPFEGVGIANLGPVSGRVVGFGGVRLRHFQASRGLRWVSTTGPQRSKGIGIHGDHRRITDGMAVDRQHRRDGTFAGRSVGGRGGRAGCHRNGRRHDIRRG